MCLLNQIGPPLYKRVNIKFIVLVGLGIMIGSLAIATNASKTFLTFELWWIFGTGLGMACVYTTVFMANWPWFGERRGMATGIMMAGFALGPVI